MAPIISVKSLDKFYDSGFQALKNLSLEIEEGEVFALLGPNGAGKTTLISTLCSLAKPTSGEIRIGGFDIQDDYREARRLVGLVPQEIPTAPFEKVYDTVSLSRGLFGLPKNPDLIETILRELSLWDKKDNAMMALSGGMKRRVLVAKALAHEPRVLFLDEPTAGVDVELRRDMWRIVGSLRDRGVTIILTTHYIGEAEEMADRVGVINNGQIILVEEKKALMAKLGRKKLVVELSEPLEALPDALKHYDLLLADEGQQIIYYYDQAKDSDIPNLLRDVSAAGIQFRDLNTSQSSLEDIFVDLVKAEA
ncbi:MAG: ABC transporter ATP-binding protein [Rhodobacteraceae bacterium]|nr:ABC transporter ATP-binding protein [Paracoccaceae bacterium]